MNPPPPNAAARDDEREHARANALIALACLDLTSLNEDDTAPRIAALAARCHGLPVAPAALCVWPRFAAQARAAAPAGVRVAAVANFPEGQGQEREVLREVRQIVAAGAQEIDLVLPWRALAAGDWRAPAALVGAVRRASWGRTLKLIVESGALSRTALAAACRIGLDEGADFLKTSTGKGGHPGATLEAARTMMEAIAAHPRAAEVGFKASGGLRSLTQVAGYIALARELLGAQALQPGRLRFGASALLEELLAELGVRGPQSQPRPDARAPGY